MALGRVGCFVYGGFFGAILFRREGMIPFLLLIIGKRIKRK